MARMWPCSTSACVLMPMIIAALLPEVVDPAVAPSGRFPHADSSNGNSSLSHLLVMGRPYLYFIDYRGVDRRSGTKAFVCVATDRCVNPQAWCCTQISLPQPAYMNTTDQCRWLHMTINPHGTLAAALANTATNKTCFGPDLTHATLATVSVVPNHPYAMRVEICISPVLVITTTNKTRLMPTLAHVATSETYTSPRQPPASTDENLSVPGQATAMTDNTVITEGQAPAANVTQVNSFDPAEPGPLALAHALLTVTHPEQNSAAKAIPSINTSPPAQDRTAAATASNNTAPVGQATATSKPLFSGPESPGQASGTGLVSLNITSASGQTATNISAVPRLDMAASIPANGRPPTGTLTEPAAGNAANFDAINNGNCGDNVLGAAIDCAADDIPKTITDPAATTADDIPKTITAPAVTTADDEVETAAAATIVFADDSLENAPVYALPIIEAVDRMTTADAVDHATTMALASDDAGENAGTSLVVIAAQDVGTSEAHSAASTSEERSSATVEVAMGWSESVDWSRLLDDVPHMLHGRRAAPVKTLGPDMLLPGTHSGLHGATQSIQDLVEESATTTRILDLDTGVAAEATRDLGIEADSAAKMLGTDTPNDLDEQLTTWMRKLIEEMSADMSPKVKNPPPCTLSKRSLRQLLKSCGCVLRARAGA